MKNKLTHRRIGRWLPGVLVMLLPFLFMDCRSYPFGSMLADKTGYYYQFTGTLDAAHGFDRLVFLRLVIDDPDHILAGLTKWLRLSPTNQRQSIDLCDITYNQGTGRGFDVIIAFQAKTGSVVLRNLSCFDFKIGYRGIKTSEKRVGFPLELKFNLAPNALNYLGRLHLAISDDKPGATRLYAESDKGLFLRASDTPVRYSLKLTRDDACFREDLELFRTRNPKMRLPENIVPSPAE